MASGEPRGVAGPERSADGVKKKRARAALRGRIRSLHVKLAADESLRQDVPRR